VTGFLKKVVLATIIIALGFALIAVVSILTGGFGVRFCLYFLFGLLAGTLAAVINLFIMTYCTDIALNRGKKLMTVIGLVIRMVVYAAVFCGVFYLFGRDEYSAGLTAGIGAGLGFLTSLIAIMWVNAALPMFRARRAARRTGSKPPEYIYEEVLRDGNGRIRYLLVGSQSFDIWRGNRHYVTHKKFRKLHELRRAEAI
jgi:MFS family permease